MAKKRGLGRGLDALLSGASMEDQVSVDLTEDNSEAQLTEGYKY